MDADNDGYAVSPIVTNISSPGQGYTTTVLPLTDCDDTNANVFKISTWHLDEDSDGYAILPTIESCNSTGTGYTNTTVPTTDCVDTDAEINPETLWFVDANNDGIEDVEEFPISCEKHGIGYASTVLRPFLNEIIIKAYPNPTSNTIEIDLGGLIPEVELTIVNATGQLIKKEFFTNTRTITLNFNSLASGIYFIAIQSENKILEYQKISKR